MDVTLFELKDEIIENLSSKPHQMESEEFTFTYNPNIEYNSVKIKSKDEGNESIGIWKVETITEKNEVILLVKNLHGHMLLKHIYTVPIQ